MSSPTGRIVGRVGVRVLPNTSSFVPALQKYLDRIEKTLTVNLRTGLDVSGALDDSAKLREELQREDADITIGLADTRARAELDALKAEIAGSKENISVGVDKSHLSEDLSGLRSALAGVAKTVTIPIAAAGIATAVASATALLAILIQAAGAAALIPAALAGLAAVGGAAIIGLSGIGPALQDFSKSNKTAGDTASASAKQQTDAARQIAAAQRGLKSAYESASDTAIQSSERIADAEQNVTNTQRDELTAQQELNQARIDALQNIEDLRVQLSGAAVDQKAAAVQLADAKAALIAAQSNDFSTPQELADAQLAVDQANQKVAETAQNYKDLKQQSDAANKAGVDGAQNVKDAQQKVLDTQQAAAHAQRDLADAQRQSARDQENAANAILDAQDRLAEAQESANSSTAAGAKAADTAKAAFNKLAPAGKALVTALLALGPAWHSVHLDVQQWLLAGVAAQVSQLGHTALPILDRGLSGVAGSLNLATKQFLTFANQKSTGSAFAAIFASIKDALDRLIPAVKPAMQALLDLTRVGSSFGPGIASTIAGFIERISGAISKASSDGSLSSFLAGALLALKQLGQLLGNVGGILVTIFKSGAGSGKQLLGSLVTITGTISSLLKTAGGQNGLASIFSLAADASSQLQPLVSALAPVVSSVLKAIGPLVSSLLPAITQTIAALGPGISAVVSALGPALSSLGPALVVLGNAFSQGLAAAAPALKPLAKLIGTLVVALAPLLPVIGQIIGQLLPPLAQMFTAVYTALSPLVTSLASALKPLLPVIAGMITQLVAAVAPFLTQLVSALAPILPVIAQALIEVLTAISPLIPVFGQLLEAVAPLLPPIAKLIASLIKSNVFLGLVKVAAALLVKTLPLLLPVIRIVVDALGGIITAVTKVNDFMGDLFSTIKGLPGKLVGLAGKFLSAGASIASNIFNGLKQGLKDVGGFVSNIASDIWNAIKDFVNKEFIDPIRNFKWKLNISIHGIGYHHTFQPFGSIPELAAGATVLPSEGGTLAVLAEAGKAETVTDTGLTNRNLDLQNRLIEKVLSMPGAGAAGLTQHIYGAEGQDESTLAADVARRWSGAGRLMAGTLWSVDWWTGYEGKYPLPDDMGCLVFVTEVDGWSGVEDPRVDTTDRPANDGTIDGQSTQPGKTITISGTVRAPDQLTLLQWMDRANSLLMSGSRYATLTAQEPHVTRTMLVRRGAATLISPTATTGWEASFSFVLYAPDPRKLGDVLTASTGLPASSGGLTIPFRIPFTIASTVVSGRCSLVNPGSATGPVQLRIQGPIVAPIVTHVSTGLQLVFASSLSLAGDEWVDVDMEEHSVLANGLAARDQWVVRTAPNFGWAGFDPGENIWSLAASSGSGLLTVNATPAWT